MSDVLHLEDRIYVLSTSSLMDDRRSVLKHGESFGVFDRRGDIAPIGLKEQGLYHEGCRHISRLELMIAGVRPIPLSASTLDMNQLDVDLANPDIGTGETKIRHGSVHVLRSKVLRAGILLERITLSSYENVPLELPVVLRVGTDFVDIFEVRGARRTKRGDRARDSVEDFRITFSYAGLDGRTRTTIVSASPEPIEMKADEIAFIASLPPHGQQVFEVTIRCLSGTAAEVSPLRGSSFESLLEENTLEIRKNKLHEGLVLSSNSALTSLISQSLSDVHLLTTLTEQGPYPYAGVPWFSAAFGRDAIITAMMMLWINPIWAEGVLSFLAYHQATEEDPSREAQPGKILHELRLGEMALTGEVPFAHYYGSVDSTPMFVMLAAAYLKRTGNVTFVKNLWPNIVRALEWLERYGDVDGDGFVEYAPWGVRGLTQQGWKDSNDSVFHRDGPIAEPPIALCEVQGYVYAAKIGAAEIAERIEAPSWGPKLRAEAASLRKNFHDRFWDSELQCYALALDGNKRPCSVRSSNAAHALFTKIAEPQAAAALVRTLFQPHMFTGWGIRTLSSKEIHYNPLSYHNGSVWPHDNAMAAYGLACYGYQPRAAQLLECMIEASTYIPMQRMPELYCGFERRKGLGPTLHPIACSPQAWAAGSVFMILQSCLGLSLDAFERRVIVEKPSLPASVGRVELLNLALEGGSIDLTFERYEQDVGVQVLRRSGDLGVSILK